VDAEPGHSAGIVLVRIEVRADVDSWLGWVAPESLTTGQHWPPVGLRCTSRGPCTDLPSTPATLR